MNFRPAGAKQRKEYVYGLGLLRAFKMGIDLRDPQDWEYNTKFPPPSNTGSLNLSTLIVFEVSYETVDMYIALGNTGARDLWNEVTMAGSTEYPN